MKLNCWEKMQCGLQPGGKRTRELGICPVAVETKANFIHGGINGGRSCWAIQKTLRGRDVQCRLDHNLDSCIQCDFYAEVRSDQGTRYLQPAEILAKVKRT